MSREWTRDQLSAMEADDNIIVSASAGSGKTAVLIEKIFLLLREGKSLKNMAVMTFTDLAACELKDRLTDKLLEAIRAGEDAERLKSELEYIPFADVSTIHSFCKRLYKRYYAEIGEDFYEETLSGDEATSLYRECAEQAILEMRSRNIEAFDNMFWHFYGRDRGGAKLVSAIVELHAFLECVENKDDFIALALKNATLPFEQKQAYTDYLADFRAKVARLRVALDEFVEDAKDDVGYQDNQQFLQVLAVNLLTLADATDLQQLLKRGETCLSVGLPNLKKTKFGIDSLKTRIERIRASYKDLLELITTSLGGYQELLEEDRLAGMHLEQLLLVTRLTEEYYQATKKKEGKIDFSDLERLASMVIADPDRLGEICAGYDYVFVDEYQDTNYLQDKIVMSVATTAKAFFIGDGKQSIYQFRYAEPKIFFDRYRNYESGNGGVNATFRHNFRSDQRILDFVNKVFGGLMTLSFGNVDYNREAFVSGSIDYPDLTSLADGKTLEPVVEVAVFPAPARERANNYSPSYDVSTDDNFEDDGVDKEGEYIASRIKRLMGSPIVHNPIRKVANGTAESYTIDQLRKRTRGATLKDCAVLVNTHAQAKKISRVLTARGIANYVHSGGGEDEYAEDREFLLAYLRLLSSLHDDVSLAVVLLSPLTSFSEQDLLTIRGGERKTPFWVSFINYSGDQTLVDKRDAFLASINKHRAIAATSNVRTLVETIIKDFSYDAYIMGDDNGDERIASLNMFLESLSHLSSSADLTRFNQYVARGAKWSYAPPSGGGNAVSIMTMHASKGLEFPIVFVPYAHYEGNKRGGRASERDFLIADRDYGVAIDYYNDAKKTKRHTLTGSFLETKKKKNELEERLRLMYVAMTRAKNHLFISMQAQNVKKHFADENGTFGKWLQMAREANPTLDALYVDSNWQDCQADDAKAMPAMPHEENFELLDFVYPYETETKSEVKYTVTSLMQDGERGAVVDVEQSERVRLLGVAYHAVLERIDFNRVERGDIEDIIKELVFSGDISEEIATELSIDTISNILKLPVFKLATTGRTLREKDFMLYLPACEVVDDQASTDRVLVQGVIDLLILGEQNVLVDYKYSALSQDKLTAKYKKQISLYKTAVEKLLKLKIDKAVIIALKSAKEIEII